MKIVYSCPNTLGLDKPILTTGAAGVIHTYLLDGLLRAKREKGYDVSVITPEQFDYKKDAHYGAIIFDSLASYEEYLKSADVFIGSGCCSLHQMERVKQHGGKVATTWFNSHWAYTKKIMEEEQPKLSIVGPVFDPLLVWRAQREQLFCDRIIVTGSECAKTYDAVPELKGKVKSVGFGVDSNRFQPSDNKPDGFHVLFVGANFTRKGLLYLCEAWNKLELEDGLLSIVGTNFPFRPLWKTNVLGWINDEDVPKTYQANHVFVMPSLEDGGPSSTLEAMASGLPVIATKMGSNSMVDDWENGIIVEPRNRRDISNALLYFHENPDELKKMGRNAREKALQWPWERFGDNVVKVLEEMVES